MQHPKTVLITGASTGIGRTCALRLERAGWQVFAGVRKAEDAEALKAAGSEKLIPVMIDVTKAETIAEAKASIHEHVGDVGLGALVNNAGIAMPGPLEFIEPDELAWQLNVNVVGQVAVTQQFLPMLRETKGRVVMMSSISGELAVPVLGPYSASKFALEAITDSLRVEVSKFDIDVIAVQPGQIKTPIWDKGKARAKTMEEQYPKEAFELYGEFIELAVKTAHDGAKNGADPNLVADAVLDALTSRKPKTRYAVGKGAKAAKFLAKWMPDRTRDKLLGYRFKG